MKIWYSNSMPSVWMGGAAVVVAPTEEEAKAMLLAELRKNSMVVSHNINPDKWTCEVEELDITKAHVIVLQDGEY